MRTLLPVAAIAAVLLLPACTSNVVGPDDTESPPQTNVSFAADVFPILNASCAVSGCHVGSGQSGVVLSSYSALMSSVGQRYGKKIVVAGDGASSPIVEAISGTSSLVGRMPPGGSLTAAQVAAIRTWIDEGALNN